MLKLTLRALRLRRVLIAAATIALLDVWLGGQAAATAAAAGSGTAAASDPAVQFRQTADSLYRSVNEGDPLVVLRKVREAEEALAGIPKERLPSAESAAALEGSVERMRRAMSALTPDEQEVYEAAAALRLAADAVAPDGQGLWLDYRRLMREEVSSLAESFGDSGAKPDAAALAKLESLIGHYELIRASAAASGRAAYVERADAVFSYARRVLGSPASSAALIAPLPQQIRSTVEALFPPEREKPASTVLPTAPPAGFFTALGAFILTALTYSGWRKYRGEVKKGRP